MVRKTLLLGAALVALSVPAMAANTAQQAATQAAAAQVEPTQAQNQTAFSQALKSIRGWFGADTPASPAVQAGTTTTAAADDMLQAPPPVDGQAPQNIEPAAGFDEDALQAPPPYYGPQSNATPRASSFDGAASVAAFGDAQTAPVANAQDLSNIAPAAGDVPMDRANLDCVAILKAAESAEEGDRPEAALVTACNEAPPAADGTGVPAAPAAGLMPVNPATEPAQPAFEPGLPQAVPTPLPATQPAAGDPAPAVPADAAHDAAPEATPVPATAPAQP